HADGRVSRWLGLRHLAELVRGNGLSIFLPHVGKSRDEIGTARPLNLNPSVPPGFDPALGIPEPGIADTDSGNEAQRSIDHQGLPMVAAQPAEGAVESRRIVITHGPAGLDQG